MKTRTVYFIIDPFEDTRCPIAVLAEIGGRVYAEPIPPPVGLVASARIVAEMAVADIREAPSMTTLPDSVGPQVVLGPMHEPLKSQPREVFDALLRLHELPEAKAEIDEALRKGRGDADAAWRARPTVPGFYR